MKKRLTVILSSFMVLSLFGCGTSETLDYDSTQAPNAASVENVEDVVEDSSEGNDTEDASGESAGADYATDSDPFSEDITVDLMRDLTLKISDKLETGDGPLIYIRKSTFYKSTDHPKRIYTNEKDFLYLAQENDERYSGIKKALDDYNASIDQSGLIISKDELNSAYDAVMAHTPGAYNHRGYYDYGTSYISRVDDNVLSIKYVSENYRGGSRKTSEVVGYVYDSVTGDRLSISNVVSNIDELKTAAVTTFERDYSDIAQSDPGSEDKLSQSFDNEESINWNMGPTALNIYYNSNQLTENGLGTQVISIRYNDYPSLFNSGYGEVSGNWIQSLDEASGNVIMEDISGDGVSDYIYTELMYDGDNDSEYTITNGIKIGTAEEEVTFDTYNFDSSKYLVKRNGRYYIYVVLGSGDAQDNIHTYEITNGHIAECNNLAYSLCMPANSYELTDQKDIDGFYMSIRGAFYNTEFFYTSYLTHIIGLWGGYASCGIEDGGSIAPLKGYYEFPYDSKMTSKMEQTFSQVDESGNEIGIMTIPSGTVYHMYRTDDSGYLDFTLDDGTIVRVIIENSGNAITVNGSSFDDVFELSYD